jgi:hypothetical protein
MKLDGVPPLYEIADADRPASRIDADETPYEKIAPSQRFLVGIYRAAEIDPITEKLAILDGKPLHEPLEFLERGRVLQPQDHVVPRIGHAVHPAHGAATLRHENVDFERTGKHGHYSPVSKNVALGEEDVPAKGPDGARHPADDGDSWIRVVERAENLVHGCRVRIGGEKDKARSLGEPHVFEERPGCADRTADISLA